MRIIKNGNPPKTYEGECPFCGCKYEYEASDIYTEYDLISMHMYSVTCPWCGCRNSATNYFQKIIPSYYIGDMPHYKTWDITCDNSDYHTKNICEDKEFKKELLKCTTHLDATFEKDKVDND